MKRLSLAVLSAATVIAAMPASASAQPHHGRHSSHPPYRFAVIGDLPYGDAQIAALPQWIDQINGDRSVSLVQHVGDIKNGSTRCDTSYFQLIKKQFDRFAVPLVYSPGDNEWTDCHRANNGAYNPLERLGAVRDTFFAKPNTTNGRKRHIASVNRSFPEIVNWSKAGVSFTALHVVGSNDDLNAWSGIGKAEATAEQVAEEKARMDANIRALRTAFADARKHHSRAVSISMQADMFDPTYDVQWKDDSAFKPLVTELVKQSNAFHGPVYLFNGDSHVYNSDQPLAKGSKWLDFYGIKGSADNLRRVTVDGSSNNQDWLKVTVTQGPEVLTWQRVPYTVQVPK